MAIADVHTWLEGSRPFDEGLLLLKEHGRPNGALLSLLERGDTGYARERLVEALTAIAVHATAVQQSAPRLQAAPDPSLSAAEAMRSLSEDMDDWPLSKYPIELQELKLQVRELLREFDSLHGELRRIPTKEERYRTALRLKELDDMIHAGFYRLDTFRKTGTDIGMVSEVPKSRAELVVERNSLRTYISRAAKGTRNASPEQVAAWKARIRIIQTTIDAGDQG